MSESLSSRRFHTSIRRLISSEKIVVSAFFLAFLLVGLAIYKDYGISWDEPEQQRYGHTVVDYMFTGDPKLLSDWDRYHGPAFEIVLDIADRVFGPSDTKERFWLRHLLNFLLFYGSVWCFFFLCRKRFQDWRIALLGCVLLVMSPRIFGQAFYNSKDLPFLASMIVSFLTLQDLAEQKTVKRAILHGLASGFAVSIRVLGLLVPAITLLWLVGDIAFRKRTNRKAVAAAAALYVAVFFGTTVLFWPILWHDPLTQLWQALEQMSRFPWPGEVLYLGKDISASNLPWHYIPVWMLVTIPIAYIGLFCVGMVSLARDLVRDGRHFLRSRTLDLAVLAWLLIPIGMVIALGSVVYDAWRHLYFVYPAFVFVTLIGLVEVWRVVERSSRRAFSRSVGAVVVTALSLQLWSVGRFMAEAHPYEDVYFNAFIGGLRGARFRMEMDYAGLSYRKGLEALAKYDRSPYITVFVEQAPAVYDVGFLRPKDYTRFVFVKDVPSAMYFLGAYRLRTAEYPYRTLIHREEALGVPLLSTFKLRKTPPAAPVLSVYKLKETARAEALVRKAGREKIWQENARLATGMSAGDIARRIEQGVTGALSTFVSGPSAPRVLVWGVNSGQDLKEGRVGKIAVSMKEGRFLGGKHRKWCIPFRNLRIAFYDVTLKLQSLLEGKLRIQFVGRVALNALDVAASGVNAVLARQRGEKGRVRVEFTKGEIRLRWLGRPNVQIDAEVRAVPDVYNSESDNLWLHIERIGIGYLRLPGGLVQWRLRSLLPLIRPDPTVGIVELETINMEGNHLRVGKGETVPGS
jgi:hypothetical protein